MKAASPISTRTACEYLLTGGAIVSGLINVFFKRFSFCRIHVLRNLFFSVPWLVYLMPDSWRVFRQRTGGSFQDLAGHFPLGLAYVHSHLPSLLLGWRWTGQHAHSARPAGLLCPRYAFAQWLQTPGRVSSGPDSSRAHLPVLASD